MQTIYREDKTFEKITLTLPGLMVPIGPGTVPTSTASISTTKIEDMVRGLREVSKLGIFDNESHH